MTQPQHKLNWSVPGGEYQYPPNVYGSYDPVGVPMHDVPCYPSMGPHRTVFDTIHPPNINYDCASARPPGPPNYMQYWKPEPDLLSRPAQARMDSSAFASPYSPHLFRYSAYNSMQMDQLQPELNRGYPVTNPPSDIYRRTERAPQIINPTPSKKPISKGLENLDVRKFLSTWEDKDDDVEESGSTNQATREVPEPVPLDCSVRTDVYPPVPEVIDNRRFFPPPRESFEIPSKNFEASDQAHRFKAFCGLPAYEKMDKNWNVVPHERRIEKIANVDSYPHQMKPSRLNYSNGPTYQLNNNMPITFPETYDAYRHNEDRKIYFEETRSSFHVNTKNQFYIPVQDQSQMWCGESRPNKPSSNYLLDLSSDSNSFDGKRREEKTSCSTSGSLGTLLSDDSPIEVVSPFSEEPQAEGRRSVDKARLSITNVPYSKVNKNEPILSSEDIQISVETSSSQNLADLDKPQIPESNLFPETFCEDPQDDHDVVDELVKEHSEKFEKAKSPVPEDTMVQPASEPSHTSENDEKPVEATESSEKLVPPLKLKSLAKDLPIITQPPSPHFESARKRKKKHHGDKRRIKSSKEYLAEKILHKYKKPRNCCPKARQPIPSPASSSDTLTVTNDEQLVKPEPSQEEGEKDSNIKCSLSLDKIISDESSREKQLKLVGSATINLKMKGKRSEDEGLQEWKIVEPSAKDDSAQNPIKVKNLIMKRNQSVPKVIIKKTVGKEYQSFLSPQDADSFSAALVQESLPSIGCDDFTGFRMTN